MSAFDGDEKADRKIEFWKSRAEKGIANSQYSLGLVYHYGEGVEKDDKAVVFRKAADQGRADAQFSLGWMAKRARWSRISRKR